MRRLALVFIVFHLLLGCTVNWKPELPPKGKMKQAVKEAVAEVLTKTKGKATTEFGIVLDLENNTATATSTSQYEFKPPLIKLNVEEWKEPIDEWEALELSLVYFFAIFLKSLIILLLAGGIVTPVLAELAGELFAVTKFPLFKRFKKMALSVIIGNILILICKLCFVRSWTFAFVFGNIGVVGSWLGWWLVFKKGIVKLMGNMFGERSDQEIDGKRKNLGRSEIIRATKWVVGKIKNNKNNEGGDG